MRSRGDRGLTEQGERVGKGNYKDEGRKMLESILSLPSIHVGLHRHVMSEREAIERAYPGEIISIIEFNKLYVVKVNSCDPEKARIFKENLKKMGFKRLTKRVVVSCR